MDVFLNITNPLLKRDGSAMTESELNAYLKRVGKKLNIPDRELGNSSQFSRVPSYVGETIQAYLKEQGYDGIPYINSWEDRGNVSSSPSPLPSNSNYQPPPTPTSIPPSPPPRTPDASFSTRLLIPPTRFLRGISKDMLHVESYAVHRDACSDRADSQVYEPLHKADAVRQTIPHRTDRQDAHDAAEQFRRKSNQPCPRKQTGKNAVRAYKVRPLNRQV